MAFNWFRKKKEKEPIEADKENKIPEPDEEEVEPSHVTEIEYNSSSPVEKSVQEKKGSTQKKSGFFSRLREGLSKTRRILTTDLDHLFIGKKKIDDEMIDNIEELLITSDIGVRTSMDIIDKIRIKKDTITTPTELKELIKKEILTLFDSVPVPEKKYSSSPHVIMVVGVNGVGKTTTIGKLSAIYTKENRKVLIAASDTFRAAAIEQLEIWANASKSTLIKHKANSDPSAVAYDAMQAAIARNADVVIVDTAGRLHTKVNLMEEIKKIDRTMSKIIPGAPHETWLVLDATTGQNALTQAEMFHRALGLTGIVLTKLDGTAKGGIIIGISSTLNIPIRYIGIGEGIDDLYPFNPEEFVNALF